MRRAAPEQGKMPRNRSQEWKGNFTFRLNCNKARTKDYWWTGCCFSIKGGDELLPWLNYGTIADLPSPVPVDTDELSQGSWVKMPALNRSHSLSRKCGWYMLMSCFICVHPNEDGLRLPQWPLIWTAEAMYRFHGPDGEKKFFFFANVFSSGYGYVLGYRDQMERGTHSSILAWWATVHGITKSQTQLSN